MIKRAANASPLYWASIAVICLSAAHMTFRIVLTYIGG